MLLSDLLPRAADVVLSSREGSLQARLYPVYALITSPTTYLPMERFGNALLVHPVACPVTGCRLHSCPDFRVAVLVLCRRSGLDSYGLGRVIRGR